MHAAPRPANRRSRHRRHRAADARRAILLASGSARRSPYPVRGEELLHLPAHARDGLRHRDPRAEPAHRLQRPVLARPLRVLRHRRLHGGDHDGAWRHRLRLDAPGRRPRLLRRSASCSACRRCGSKASISRSRPSRSRSRRRRCSNLSPLEHWTGGVQGIVIIKPDAPFGLPLNRPVALFLHRSRSRS